jgi:hypothetical protein
MSHRPRMRPTFEVPLTVAADVFLARLRDELHRANPPLSWQVFRRHAVATVATAHRKSWSPYLNLEVTDGGDEGGIATVHGRFSPHPSVWTGIMALYGVLVMAALGAAMTGIAQLSLGRPPWALLALPAAAAAAGLVFTAAVIGQRLGGEQMTMLRAVVDRAAR